jgi:hypothetical protein
LRRKSPDEEKVPIHISSTGTSTLEIPANLHLLQDVDIGTKPEPVFKYAIETEWYEEKKEEMSAVDMAWILARRYDTEDLSVPGWSGFNQTLSKIDPLTTEVCPLPIINATAHDFSTIWTVMQNCKAMTKKLNETFTVMTFDEALYCKAKMLQWEKGGEDFVIMLGGFHTQMNFTKVIGQHMEASGLSDIWQTSGAYGENTAHNIIKGKIWNRVIRAHKLTFEAIWVLLWSKFLSWMQTKERFPEQRLADLAAIVSMGFSKKDDKLVEDSTNELLELLEDMPSDFEDFDKEHCESNASFKFWREYMRLMYILLQFTRALRDGMWVPVSLYLCKDVTMVRSVWTHPLYEMGDYLPGRYEIAAQNCTSSRGFMAGDFVTKETPQKFNQISDDQALEHINKTGKIAGGLIGITRSDSARDRWCITYNERTQLVRDTKEMFNITAERSEDDMLHKDLGTKRLKTDKQEMRKIVDEFEKFGIFSCEAQELVSLTTGDVAPGDVQEALLTAHDRGVMIVHEFVTNRLVKKTKKFHDPIKTPQHLTFNALYTVKSSSANEKTVPLRNNRQLFQKVIVAMEAGRDVDVDKLLVRELYRTPYRLQLK